MAIDVSSAGGALLITILRALHIVCGLVWVGAALLMTIYIEPTAERAGADGRRVLRALYRTTSFSRLVPASAIITTVAGLLLYEMLSYSAAISTATGMTITIGAALACWLSCTASSQSGVRRANWRASSRRERRWNRI